MEEYLKIEPAVTTMLNPNERIVHSLGKKLVKEKLLQEIGEFDQSDSSVYMPDAIICTLDELLIYLELEHE